VISPHNKVSGTIAIESIASAIKTLLKNISTPITSNTNSERLVFKDGIFLNIFFFVYSNIHQRY
jgi:hypothetical protein